MIVTTIAIRTTPADLQARLRNAPTLVLRALAAEMNRQNQLTIEAVSEKRLRGKGPFPVAQHRLGVVSGVLRESLWATPAAASASGVQSSIGTNVRYAGLHEFGGTVTRRARRAKIRLRLRANGELLRQERHPNLARFAGRAHLRAREQEVEIGAHTATYPARAPITTGIQERADAYGRALSRAALQAMGGPSA